jgi:hypothetical protein
MDVVTRQSHRIVIASAAWQSRTMNCHREGSGAVKGNLRSFFL